MNSHGIAVLCVNGFLGHSGEGLMKNIDHFLSEKKILHVNIDFPGNNTNHTKLMNLHEMVAYTTESYNNFRFHNPDKSIILLGHSQGSAIILRMLSQQQIISPAILIAPLVDTATLVTKRINSEEKLFLERNEKLEKNFGRDRIRVISRERIDSYHDFLPIDILKTIGNHITIIRASADLNLDESHTEILKNSLPDYEYKEITADHTFSSTNSQNELALYLSQIFQCQK